MSLYLGIDFGTSTNYITRWDQEKRTVVPVCPSKMAQYASHRNWFPNVIYYEANGNKVVGSTAQIQGIRYPDSAVFSVKREIGTQWTKQIRNTGKTVGAFEVCRDIFNVINNNIREDFGGALIDGVVITVPYAYQHRERSLIQKAANAAGLHVIRLLEEPVAAALAQSVFSQDQDAAPRKVLIFDLGGGTLDVTVFEFSKQDGVFVIEVLNTAGHKKLGGDDIDEKLKTKLVEDALKIDLEEQDPLKNQEMLKEAREAKEALSEEEDYEMYLEYGAHDVDWQFTRETLGSLVDSEFRSKIYDVLDDAVFDAGLEEGDIDEVVLVGGSTNVPAIRALVENYFGRPLLKNRKDPEVLVGEGAGLYCGMEINGIANLRIIQKVSHAIGVKSGGKMKPLLQRNSLYQKFSEKEFFTLNRDPRSGMNTGIDIYQGNSARIETCTKIGRIAVNLMDFPDGKIGIRLGTDESGIVLYELYNSSGQCVEQDQLSEK
ncbi:MAG: Hsp70 family protein [Oscillibacter sp.]|nr:Hsp70 family protein [Oscillibacter sp.]